ncbi:glycosyl transferase [Nocardioides baekrokdamisoli]|uniref:Glycosyl transferase n=1 Tax=Nocardioides baekrokdamisoli TaxID=1804624 RepID=A0A3G9J0W7_9ACTN|nr:glycosyltransferase [Nocardioides baekrokdamisoli]BBH17114.1 glycosyl transferase [Nocardioides baekrokdamisoli]
MRLIEPLVEAPVSVEQIPRVALLTTVYNEAGSIHSFLRSIDAQEFRPSQVVIVDAGSDDGTVEALREWAEVSDLEVQVIVSHGASISRGRNIALAECEASWVAVTDAGNSLDPTWLKELANGTAPDVDVVAGFFEPLPGSFKQSVIGVTITPLLAEIDPKSFLPSSRSVIFRTSILKSVGGYPEWLDYCEDLVLDLMLKKVGARFEFAPGAIARWDARGTFSAYFKQYFRYARGDGKAGLWRRRHAARYTAYAVGAALVALSVAVSVYWLLLLAVLGSIYSRKFAARVFARRGVFGARWMLALALVPVVVAIGDVAKMCGYPIGLAHAKAHRSQWSAYA